jgi:large subunit ribosomal protein L18e
LGSGEVHASHKVAAYSFSASAKDKIVAAGGETLSLHELMKDNPSGKEVFILG